MLQHLATEILTVRNLEKVIENYLKRIECRNHGRGNLLNEILFRT